MPTTIGTGLGLRCHRSRPEAGLLSTLQETPGSPKGSGDKAFSWPGNCGLRKLPLPWHRRQSRNTSHLVCEPQAPVPLQEPFHDRILCEERAGVGLATGTGLLGECCGAKRRTVPLLGEVVAKAEADRKRDRGDCSLDKEAG